MHFLLMIDDNLSSFPSCLSLFPWIGVVLVFVLGDYLWVCMVQPRICGHIYCHMRTHICCFILLLDMVSSQNQKAYIDTRSSITCIVILMRNNLLHGILKISQQVVGVTGLILTKLDGSARGGCVVCAHIFLMKYSFHAISLTRTILLTYVPSGIVIVKLTFFFPDCRSALLMNSVSP